MAWWDSQHRTIGASPRSSPRNIMGDAFPRLEPSPIDRHSGRHVDRHIDRHVDRHADMELERALLSPVVEEQPGQPTAPALVVQVDIRFTDPVIRSRYCRSYASSPTFEATDRICRGLVRRIERCSEEFITRKDSAALEVFKGDTYERKPQRFEMTFRVMRRGRGEWAERTYRSYQKHPLTVALTKEITLVTHLMIGLFLRRHDKHFRWIDCPVREGDSESSETMVPSDGGPLSLLSVPRSLFIEATQEYEFVPGYTIEVCLRSRNPERQVVAFERTLNVNSTQTTPLTRLMSEDMLGKALKSINQALESKERDYDDHLRGGNGARNGVPFEDDALEIDLRIVNNLGPVFSHVHRNITSKLALFRDPEAKDCDSFLCDTEKLLVQHRNEADATLNALDDLEFRIVELKGVGWTLRDPAKFILGPSASHARRTIQAALDRLQTGIGDVIRGHNIAIHISAHKRGHLVLDKAIVAHEKRGKPRESFASGEDAQTAFVARLKARIQKDIDKVFEDSCSIDDIPEYDDDYFARRPVTPAQPEQPLSGSSPPSYSPSSTWSSPAKQSRPSLSIQGSPRTRTQRVFSLSRRSTESMRSIDFLKAARDSFAADSSRPSTAASESVSEPRGFDSPVSDGRGPLLGAADVRPARSFSLMSSRRLSSALRISNASTLVEEQTVTGERSDSAGDAGEKTEDVTAQPIVKGPEPEIMTSTENVSPAGSSGTPLVEEPPASSLTSHPAPQELETSDRNDDENKAPAPTAPQAKQRKMDTPDVFEDAREFALSPGVESAVKAELSAALAATLNPRDDDEFITAPSTPGLSTGTSSLRHSALTTPTPMCPRSIPYAKDPVPRDLHASENQAINLIAESPTAQDFRTHDEHDRPATDVSPSGKLSASPAPHSVSPTITPSKDSLDETPPEPASETADPTARARAASVSPTPSNPAATTSSTPRLFPATAVIDLPGDSSAASDNHKESQSEVIYLGAEAPSAYTDAHAPDFPTPQVRESDPSLDDKEPAAPAAVSHEPGTATPNILPPDSPRESASEPPPSRASEDLGAVRGAEVSAGEDKAYTAGPGVACGAEPETGEAVVEADLGTDKAVKTKKRPNREAGPDQGDTATLLGGEEGGDGTGLVPEENPSDEGSQDVGPADETGDVDNIDIRPSDTPERSEKEDDGAEPGPQQDVAAEDDGSQVVGSVERPTSLHGSDDDADIPLSTTTEVRSEEDHGSGLGTEEHVKTEEEDSLATGPAKETESLAKSLEESHVPGFSAEVAVKTGVNISDEIAQPTDIDHAASETSAEGGMLESTADESSEEDLGSSPGTEIPVELEDAVLDEGAHPADADQTAGEPSTEPGVPQSITDESAEEGRGFGTGSEDHVEAEEDSLDTTLSTVDADHALSKTSVEADAGHEPSDPGTKPKFAELPATGPEQQVLAEGPEPIAFEDAQDAHPQTGDDAVAESSGPLGDSEPFEQPVAAGPEPQVEPEVSPPIDIGSGENVEAQTGGDAAAESSEPGADVEVTEQSPVEQLDAQAPTPTEHGAEVDGDHQTEDDAVDESLEQGAQSELPRDSQVEQLDSRISASANAEAEDDAAASQADVRVDEEAPDEAVGIESQDTVPGTRTFAPETEAKTQGMAVKQEATAPLSYADVAKTEVPEATTVDTVEPSVNQVEGDEAATAASHDIIPDADAGDDKAEVKEQPEPALTYADAVKADVSDSSAAERSELDLGQTSDDEAAGPVGQGLVPEATEADTHNEDEAEEEAKEPLTDVDAAEIDMQNKDEAKEELNQLLTYADAVKTDTQNEDEAKEEMNEPPTSGDAVKTVKTDVCDKTTADKHELRVDHVQHEESAGAESQEVASDEQAAAPELDANHEGSKHEESDVAPTYADAVKTEVPPEEVREETEDEKAAALVLDANHEEESKDEPNAVPTFADAVKTEVPSEEVRDEREDEKATATMLDANHMEESKDEVGAVPTYADAVKTEVPSEEYPKKEGEDEAAAGIVGADAIVLETDGRDEKEAKEDSTATFTYADAVREEASDQEVPEETVEDQPSDALPSADVAEPLTPAELVPEEEAQSEPEAAVSYADAVKTEVPSETLRKEEDAFPSLTSAAETDGTRLDEDVAKTEAEKEPNVALTYADAVKRPAQELREGVSVPGVADGAQTESTELDAGEEADAGFKEEADMSLTYADAVKTGVPAEEAHDAAREEAEVPTAADVAEPEKAEREVDESDVGGPDTAPTATDGPEAESPTPGVDEAMNESFTAPAVDGKSSSTVPALVGINDNDSPEPDANEIAEQSPTVSIVSGTVNAEGSGDGIGGRKESETMVLADEASPRFTEHDVMEHPGQPSGVLSESNRVESDDKAEGVSPDAMMEDAGNESEAVAEDALHVSDMEGLEPNQDEGKKEEPTAAPTSASDVVEEAEDELSRMPSVAKALDTTGFEPYAGREESSAVPTDAGAAETETPNLDGGEETKTTSTSPAGAEVADTEEPVPGPDKKVDGEPVPVPTLVGEIESDDLERGISRDDVEQADDLSGTLNGITNGVKNIGSAQDINGFATNQLGGPVDGLATDAVKTGGESLESESGEHQSVQTNEPGPGPSEATAGDETKLPGLRAVCGDLVQPPVEKAGDIGKAGTYQSDKETAPHVGAVAGNEEEILRRPLGSEGATNKPGDSPEQESDKADIQQDVCNQPGIEEPPRDKHVTPAISVNDLTTHISDTLAPANETVRPELSADIPPIAAEPAVAETITPRLVPEPNAAKPQRKEQPLLAPIPDLAQLANFFPGPAQVSLASSAAPITKAARPSTDSQHHPAIPTPTPKPKPLRSSHGRQHTAGYLALGLRESRLVEVGLRGALGDVKARRLSLPVQHLLDRETMERLSAAAGQPAVPSAPQSEAGGRGSSSRLRKRLAKKEDEAGDEEGGPSMLPRMMMLLAGAVAVGTIMQRVAE
ncbi:hypothetical protein NEMBOFW57_003044 [Staphylotrichum longicolle]|uniref:Uncharacterized protein n=1 Tax=Staphylotrichum longicolle TaxID=669026 RepID=A0AAD4HZ76_9PEZI|nr:hypothetical protein NEMBOFW57_003044 [Staphylotrichum longicolle]